MSAEFELLAARVFSALLNGIYQGLLLTLVLWVGLKLFRGVNAATRYAVEFTGLLMVVALPLMHLWLVPGVSPTSAVSTPSRNTPTTAAAESSVPVEDLDFTLDQGSTAPWTGVSEGEPEPFRVDRSPTWSEAEEPDQAVPSESASAPAAPDAAQGPARFRRDWTDVGRDFANATVVAMAAAWAETRRIFRESVAPILSDVWRHVARPWVPTELSTFLVAVWIGAAGLRLGGLVLRCAALHRLKKSGLPVPEPTVAEFDALRREMGVTRPVELRAVQGIGSPIVAGFFRPAVLVPSELARKEGMVWAPILRHELAHVRRRDDWTNLIQQVIHAAFFFHPAVWWFSRRLNLDREIACDDHVLSAAASRREYALFLADFASRAQGRNWAAPAAWSNRSQLKERISMILDRKRNASPRLAMMRAGGLSTAAAIMATMAVYVGPRVAIAHEPHAATIVASPESGEKRVEKPGDHRNPLRARAKVIVHHGAEDPHAVPDPEPARDPAAIRHRHEHRMELRLDGKNATIIAKPHPPAPVVSEVHVDPPRVAPVITRDFTFALQTEPTEPTAPRAVAPPPPPRVRRSADRADAGPDLEKRLERLERLVESLLETGSGDPEKLKGRDDVRALRPELRELEADRDPKTRDLVRKMETRKDEWVTPDTGAWKGLNQSLDDVAREVARATREAERAAREAVKAAAEHFKYTFRNVDVKRPMEAQRRALDQQRQVLQKRMEEIERQIERLDSKIDNLDDQFDRLEEEAERIVEEREEGFETDGKPTPEDGGKSGSSSVSKSESKSESKSVDGREGPARAKSIVR